MFYFHSIVARENVLKHYVNKGTNWCTNQQKNNSESFLDNKTKQI
jgi:hypothetical protein